MINFSFCVLIASISARSLAFLALA